MIAFLLYVFLITVLFGGQEDFTRLHQENQPLEGLEGPGDFQRKVGETKARFITGGKEPL